MCLRYRVDYELHPLKLFNSTVGYVPAGYWGMSFFKIFPHKITDPKNERLYPARVLTGFLVNFPPKTRRIIHQVTDPKGASFSLTRSLDHLGGIVLQAKPDQKKTIRTEDPYTFLLPVLVNPPDIQLATQDSLLVRYCTIPCPEIFLDSLFCEQIFPQEKTSGQYRDIFAKIEKIENFLLQNQEEQ